MTAAASTSHYLTWHLASSSGESCDDVCSSIGHETCNETALSFWEYLPNSGNYGKLMVAATAAGVNCGGFGSIDSSAAPLLLETGHCYQSSTPHTQCCNATLSYGLRICPCSPLPWPPAAPPLPPWACEEMSIIAGRLDLDVHTTVSQCSGIPPSDCLRYYKRRPNGDVSPCYIGDGGLCRSLYYTRLSCAPPAPPDYPWQDMPPAPPLPSAIGGGSSGGGGINSDGTTRAAYGAPPALPLDTVRFMNNTIQYSDPQIVGLATGIIIVVLAAGLFFAAACAQPGKRCLRVLRSNDRCRALMAALLVLTLAGGSGAGLAYVILSGELNSPDADLKVEFCEVKYGGIFRGFTPHPRGVYLPEWGSMCSAVFIIYCGFHLLLFWVHDSAMLRLIATMFCVNGIASFFYHMTALRSWGTSDGNSMIFLSWLVVAYVWDEFIETCSPARRPRAVEQRSRHEMPAHYWYVFVRRAISAVIWVASLAFAWWLMHAPFMRQSKSAHAIAIASPLTFILLFAVSLTITRRNERKRRRAELDAAADAEGNERPAQGFSGDRLTSFVDDRVMAGAILRLWLGIAIAAIAVVLWVMTENLCDTYDFFKVFPGHLIWHVGMTLGLTWCLVLAALLRADNFSQHPRFLQAPGPFGCLYFSVFPGLVFLVDDEEESQYTAFLRKAPPGFSAVSMEKAFDGGSKLNLDRMHLGGDPLLIGAQWVKDNVAWVMSCCPKVARQNSRWTRRMPQRLQRAGPVKTVEVEVEAAAPEVEVEKKKRRRRQESVRRRGRRQEKGGGVRRPISTRRLPRAIGGTQDVVDDGSAARASVQERRESRRPRQPTRLPANAIEVVQDGR